MTPHRGEIIHFFEGRAILKDFRVSLTLMLPLITVSRWRLVNSTYCIDKGCSGLIPQLIHSVFA